MGSLGLTGTLLGGRYRVLELLGDGGMGCVYAAEHVDLRRKLAVKVLREELSSVQDNVERFLREAQAASGIDHPNVVDITDFGRTPSGSVYFVMEYLEGEELARLMHREAPLPWTTAQIIVAQVARGLHAAHEVGIIHRDLKPANIFLTRGPKRELVVKLLDFGIAKLTRQGRRPLTGQGAIFGTARYMSPEQAAGKDVDPRSDIYATGVVLYEMLTGAAPFESDNFIAVANQHMTAPVVPPRERAPNANIPESVESLILRTLAKEPSERYQTMLEFEAAVMGASFETTAAVPNPLVLGRTDMTTVWPKAEVAVPAPVPPSASDATVIRVRPTSDSRAPQEMFDEIDRTIAKPRPPQVARKATVLSQTVIVHSRAAPGQIRKTILPDPPSSPSPALTTTVVANGWPSQAAAGLTRVAPISRPQPPVAPPVLPTASGPAAAAPAPLSPAPPLRFTSGPQPVVAPPPVLPQRASFGSSPIEHKTPPPMHVGHGGLVPALEPGYGQDDGLPPELSLKIPRRTTSRNTIVLAIAIVCLLLVTGGVAAWALFVRDDRVDSGVDTHVLTNQPRNVIGSLAPVTLSPPSKPPEPPPTKTEVSAPPKAVFKSPPVRPPSEPPTEAGEGGVEVGFNRARTAIKACGREHGALETTKVKIRFDVVGERPSNVDVDQPYSSTPLGKCVVQAVTSHATFPKTKDSRGHSAVVTF